MGHTSPALRIALCGAQGTGKTTLLGNLAPRLSHLAVIPEQATEISREWGELPKDMEIGRKAEFQAEILKRTLALEAKHRDQGFLSDRSVVDNLAYALALPNFQELLPQVVRHLATKPYTHVFFVKKAFPLVGDGIRSTDVEYQEMIEGRVASLFDQLGVRHHVVLSADRQERVDAVLSVLGAER